MIDSSIDKTSNETSLIKYKKWRIATLLSTCIFGVSYILIAFGCAFYMFNNDLVELANGHNYDWVIIIFIYHVCLAFAIPSFLFLAVLTSISWKWPAIGAFLYFIHAISIAYLSEQLVTHWVFLPSIYVFIAASLLTAVGIMNVFTWSISRNLTQTNI